MTQGRRIEFIDENGGQVGVRRRKPRKNDRRKANRR
jgi:hypothetical protein